MNDKPRMELTSSEFVPTCSRSPCSLTPYELIFTFAFPGAELWCARCGFTCGMFDAERLPATMVNKYAPEFEAAAMRYLFAVSCRNAELRGGKVRFDGRWKNPAYLPHAIRRENSEVIKNWRYEICATQS